MTAFTDYIGELLRQAAIRKDIDLAKSINNLFIRMERNFLDCDNMVSGFMVEFTADVISAIEQNVDQAIVINLIDNLIQNLDKTEPYYALSYYIELPSDTESNRANEHIGKSIA